MQIRSFTPQANLFLNAANRNQNLSFGEQQGNDSGEKEDPRGFVKINDKGQNGSWPAGVPNADDTSQETGSQDVNWGWGGANT